MSKQALGILAGILLLVAAWAFGYKVLGNLADGRAASNSPVSIAPIEEGRDAPQVRRAVNAEGANRLEKTAMPLRYRSYEPDMSGETTRACLQFSEDLDPKRTDYMDYIDVEPGGKFTTQVRDNQLCLSGFDYDEQYEITLKQGLPAQEAEGLEADDSLTIIFGDKPSVVAFSGDGIILPRIGAQGLAIETVNVDILEVEVFRVSDRILARRSPSGGETTSEGDYSWEYDNAGTRVRELIWDGEVDVDGSRNQSATTVLPLTELIGQLMPGAYVVAARRKTDDSQSRPARSWRWIISTDLALTTYQGADGLGVTVRSIDSAHVVANTRVALIANNNDVLGEAVTDRNGHVNFPAALMEGTGPVSAQMLMAYGKAGDFAMLDLSRAPLDLSDRNIGGRKVYGEVDVYAYTDRGVYRPGENVHLTMMLRDSDGRAVDREATLSILKPNGMEAYSERVSGLMAGTLVHDYAVSRSAPRGIWQAVIDIDGIGVVGMADFSVEDFVPQKITVDLETSDEVLRLSSASTLTVRSDFLYGAPGKDLEAEADMRVRVDPRPFPAFKDYHFGMADESFQELDIELGKSMTDATGMAQFDMGLEEYDFDTRAPLRAEITAGVAEPGGRYIQNSTRVPLHAHDFYLAIKPSFDDDRAPRRANADFSVIAVDDTGKPVDMDGLDWELIEEEWDYHWYRQNGRWHYRRDVRDLPMAAGEFAVSSEKPATLTQRLDWGHYRLIVTAPDNQAKASYRFAVGWRGANTSDSPDKLSIAAPSAPTRIGQSVKLTLNAPYAGQGELVIASDKVHEIRNITIPKGGSELTIKASENWGAGAYAMLTLYTPRSASERPIPRRAVGIAYMPVNVDAKTIGVEIDAPKLTRPRQTQKITLKLTGATEGTNYVTLAAIDEGILLLTKYKSPSPEGFYFGKTALGVELRDDYARLLNPNMGAPTIARSGGDGLGGEGLTSVPVKIVSLFNGPVTVRGGKTTIEVELPDFNGELRLMAVAWNERAVGSASQPMTVRDAVPADLALPRFLAPGDKAFAVVTLDNVDGAAGVYKAAISGSDLLNIETGSTDFKLGKGDRLSDVTTIIASQIGTTQLGLDVSGPRRYAAKSQYGFEVRSPFRPVTRQKRIRLAPGKSARLNMSYAEGLDLGSVDVNVSVARGPNLDPSAYAASLSRYPYGCTEQTASSGMPLLYAADIGGIPGFDLSKTKHKMQGAVDKLLGRLSNDGAFGLWSEDDGYASAWVGAYATEFVQRAKAEGYVVPKSGMQTAYNGLKEVIKLESYPSVNYDYGRSYSSWQSSYRTQRSAEAAAYAHYILARAGQGDLSKMRYFYDNQGGNMKSAMGYGHIGAALSMMGDKVRSRAAFNDAASALGYSDERDYYQSPLRDTAGLIALAAEVGNNDHEEALIKAFDADLKEPSRLHTQEKVRVVLAIRALMKDADSVHVTGENIALNDKHRGHLYAKGLEAKPVITNTGEESILLTISTTGTPLKAPLAFAEGLKMTKRILTMDGKPVDMSKVARGDQMVVSLEFNSLINRERQIVIADLLPAGVEIETLLRKRDGESYDDDDDYYNDDDEDDDGPYAWLGKISSFDVIEARDDRFVASLKTERRETYRAAYIVRAVTAGDFIVPGASIEDMYRPDAQAVTKAGRMTISVAPKG